ncbi:MAG: sigma-70 family RNA polymerase sigma factor [Acidobacteria bacterium]|nr:sigma-70 family RNA polymerase sigma factor [Acidobacteriota bacterium]
MADSTIGFDLAVTGETYAGTDYQVDSCPGEKQLIERLRAGDEEAYELLIARYQQPVYNLIWRLLNDPTDSVDVVQEVFLKIFRSVGSFRGQSTLKTWIYRIAVNEAYNHRRWFSRHRRQEVGLETDDEKGCYQDLLPDQGISPFDQLLDHETHALIEDALQHLNPKFRAAVVLRDIEDLSYEEIGEVLRISSGTVKSRIVRGREALRRCLAGRLDSRNAVNWTPQTVE